MDTPIFDFVLSYAEKGGSRFHMPGHKGMARLGCESWDITEIHGADALYEAEGIIAESEKNASALFGTKRSFYSTEGSSQCIRAMLYLALTNRAEGSLPLVVAARNVHKSFVYAAALLDLDVQWLWPEEGASLCSCPVSAAQLERCLDSLSAPPAAVYITSPDYLGGMADVSALAELCHRRGTILMVDNAHGAYLRFLRPSMHPMDLGADICCDSAHKTLPVLTGGAYLHIAKNAPSDFADNAKTALALFGSTSPSYLILSSLDLCNRELAGDYPERLVTATEAVKRLKIRLGSAGWTVEASDPLRITLRVPTALNALSLSQSLGERGIECEFADDEHLVLMLTPDNTGAELELFAETLGENRLPYEEKAALSLSCGERVMSIRKALFAPHESVEAEKALGRVCGTPTVSCPPAIPIVVSGEIIGEEAISLFRRYGVKSVDVLK